MTDRKCNACGAPIVFIKTPGGRWMPCEKYPVPYQVNESGRNPDTLVDSSGRVLRGQITRGGVIGYKMAYLPHWQFCPGAARARKTSREAKAAAMKKKEAPQVPTWEQTSLI